jgi:hypothetical protein
MLSTVAYVSPGYGKSGYGYGSVYGTLYSIFSFIITVIGNVFFYFESKNNFSDPNFDPDWDFRNFFLPLLL